MADQILTINGKQAAAGSGVLNAFSFDYIQGLQILWVSATAVTIKTGACCRPSDGLLMQPAADIVKTGLSLSASTWYHIYMYINAGNPDVEIVTTAPASPYFGRASAKTGDTSRRYLGSIKTDASSNVIGFTHYENRILYDTGAGGGTPYRVLSAGAATSLTAVLLSAVLPITSEMAMVSLTTNSTVAFFSIAKTTSSAFVFMTCPQAASSLATPPTITDAPAPSQAMAYRCNTSGGAAYIDVLGYVFGR